MTYVLARGCQGVVDVPGKSFEFRDIRIMIWLEGIVGDISKG